VPTAVPMGTVSGNAPTQSEQPASSLNSLLLLWPQNAAEADASPGLAWAPTVPATGACEGLQLQGLGGQVVMETKLLAFLLCLEF
jgi:hypothetical protein